MLVVVVSCGTWPAFRYRRHGLFLLRCQDKIPVRQLAKFSHLGRTAQKWRKRKPSYYLLIYVTVVNVSALKRTASKMWVKVNLALYVKWCIHNEQKSELLLTMPNCGSAWIQQTTRDHHRPNVSGPKTRQTEFCLFTWVCNRHIPHFVHFLVPQTKWVRPKSHHRPNL